MMNLSFLGVNKDEQLSALRGLIHYHQSLSDNAKLYSHPSMQALEDRTTAVLQAVENAIKEKVTGTGEGAENDGTPDGPNNRTGTGNWGSPGRC